LTTWTDGVGCGVMGIIRWLKSKFNQGRYKRFRERFFRELGYDESPTPRQRETIAKAIDSLQGLEIELPFQTELKDGGIFFRPKEEKQV